MANTKNQQQLEEQRLDKWLWCARMYKTRAIAADAIKTGRVDLGEQRAKPARSVRVGDLVTVRRPPYQYDLLVVGIHKQRVAAAKTPEIYRELDESIATREALAASIKATHVDDDWSGRRPTKKERRDRERLKRTS